MPKSQIVDPKQVRQAQVLKLPEIPVNQYKTPLADERKRYGDPRLVGVLEDMLIIREFETMLQKVKLEGSYEGIKYDHLGPAHLSIGQEASAVGQALNLTTDDYIFGSHRSHGEILAKGMSAIRTLADADLTKVMREFDGGACLKVVEKGAGGSTKDLATEFLVYGALAEIFAKITGFNKGLGGSMHAFFTPFGIYPNNAIVGGSADIAAGAALYKQCNQRKGIVIANIGDASMGCGPVWEALNFASMDQLETLWEQGYKGGLPIIFNFFNNFYGMGGQTCGETMGYGFLARVGAGVNDDAMHAERVDGYNPLAVADAVIRKRKLIEERRGPALLDTITYRISGHSPSDASSYREKAEIEAWQQADPILAYSKQLIDAGVCSEATYADLRAKVKALMVKTLKLAIDPVLSPRMDAEAIGELMYSNSKAPRLDTREPVLREKLADNVRVKQIAGKVRSLAGQTAAVPKAKQYNVSDAIFEAMAHHFATDSTLVAYGEENRDWGGAFGAYRGLTELLPYHRLFNSPISEAAIVGTGVGYALCGGRAVVELMYCDFLGRAGDEVFNQMAKWQSMSAGVLKMPLTLRISVGAKYGAQHSQDWVAMCAMIPGLKVAFPVTPYDAKGILHTALNGTDPVVYFESQRLYQNGEEFAKDVPAGFYEIPEGAPALRRPGKDLTILTMGATMYRALEAAKILQDKYGISAEVWDARWAVPFDYEPIVESVKRTGRIVLASDACERGSFMHTMGSTIQRLAFGKLDAPPVVIGTRNWISPAAELESSYFPQPSWIIDAIHEKILPLKGHVVSSNQGDLELLRRARKGI
jgi:2-oxoisovalerate dehydrogenase E1 component